MAHAYCTTVLGTGRVVSGNGMGVQGWGAVMEAVELCSELEEMCGVKWPEVWRGELKTLDLGGKRDAGLAVACAARFLGRSASCLTELNMRLAKQLYSELFM